MNRLLITLLFVAGCMPPPDGCPPESMRCSDDGIPQVCSGSMRWTNIQHDPCNETAVCCATPSVYDATRIVHACVPAAACLQGAP